MQFEDEKDYVMRIIKELVQVMVSLILGKSYVQVELPPENKFGISGDNLSKWKDMIDSGKINEAENLLLERLDYQNRDELAEAVFFYEYLSQKGNDFLKRHNYSEEEVLDGLRQVAVQSGYEEIVDMLIKVMDTGT